MSRSSKSDEAGVDPQRPDDYEDGTTSGTPAERAPRGPKLSPLEWLRFAWRQLTSMRTALVLLLMLALAAVPGSLVPQYSSDPNGVTVWRDSNPNLLWMADLLQLHNVYTSIWFSAIYLLLFISLIGCVLPRTKHHWKALRTQPPKTPSRLQKLVGYTTIPGTEADIDRAEALLRKSGYRVRREPTSVSAERGYLRETGNLIFHAALVGVLISVALGGALSYNGQRLVVEGQTFPNVLSSYDSFREGPWFDANHLPAYSIGLNSLEVEYEYENQNAFGMPLDFTANVEVTDDEGTRDGEVKVNAPLHIQGNDVYLISNGYAPKVTVRDANDTVIFSDFVPFLAQDDNLTSLGIIKVADGFEQQLGFRGFFYPSAATLETGALTSVFPDLVNPYLTLELYQGDLGLDDGIPRSVYALDTAELEQIAGREAEVPTLEMALGATVDLPNGLGTITFDDVQRYAVFDVHHDPTQLWVLVFAVVLFGSLIISLFIRRRRVWVKATPNGLELAGLARGDDPTLEAAVANLAEKLAAELHPEGTTEPSNEKTSPPSGDKKPPNVNDDPGVESRND
ncbi:cytochrome c biogenesis protein ResB [Humidisolicoccus flavus]|uniref:cytochrome c biogenesis protein ResB n=1 Tax=Humidisolicoccus flavus TaxID=3111414 RepID=UPI00324AB1D6